TTVNKAKPTIATSATTEVTVGGKVKDEATLKNLVNTLKRNKTTLKSIYNHKSEAAPLFRPDAVEVAAGGTREETVHSAEFTPKPAGTITLKSIYSAAANI